jgi:hypothetical protein
MAFDWNELLQLARFLQDQAGVQVDKEAALRGAISRAYQAAFCHVRNYARDRLGFQPRNSPEDHGRLRAHLKKGKTRVLAERLDDLRLWRNQCDYLDELPFDPIHQSVAALDKASQIFVAV